MGELPDALPVFPLAGALLLPRGRLPLNVFEPRYLAMVDDAMKTDHRLIGMVQPHEAQNGEQPRLRRYTLSLCPRSRGRPSESWPPSSSETGAT